MKTETAKHTPRPWRIERVGYRDRTPRIVSGIKKIADVEDDADAAFIVRAVNAHDKLILAAKLVMSRWESGDLAAAVRNLSDAVIEAEGSKP